METAEEMDTEEIAELLDEAHADSPDGSRGPRQSNEEGSEEGMESDEVTDGDDDDELAEDRYNSAGEEVGIVGSGRGIARS